MQLHFKDGGVPQIQVLKRCSREGSPRHTAAGIKGLQFRLGFRQHMGFRGVWCSGWLLWNLPLHPMRLAAATAWGNKHALRPGTASSTIYTYIYTYTHIYLYLSISYVWTFYLFIVHSTYLFTVVPFLEAFSPTWAQAEVISRAAGRQPQGGATSQLWAEKTICLYIYTHTSI